MVITSTLNKKVFEALLIKTITKKNIVATVFALDTAKLVGFHYATASGLSISLEDLKTPKEKEDLLETLEKRLENISKGWLAGHVTERERFQTMIDGWIDLSEDVKEKIIDSHQSSDPLNNLFLMAFSGARGNMAQVRQIIGMRGLMTDQSGNVIDIPISSSFRQGLTVVDYIISAYGARKGVVDTALRTADAGYLTRRLVYIGQNIVIKEIDCKTTRGVSKPFFKGEQLHELTGKILLSLEKLEVTSSFFPGSVDLEKIFTQKDIPFLSAHLPLLITYRSSFTCHSLNSICQKCYGRDLSEFEEEKLIQLGEAVGILAAQSIGEPGTQMTMRTFHTGGVFIGQKIVKAASPFAGKITFPSALQTSLSRDSYGNRNYKLLASQELELANIDGKSLKFKLNKGDFLYMNKSTYIPKGVVVYEPQKASLREAKKVFRTLRSALEGELFFHRLFFFRASRNSFSTRSFQAFTKNQFKEKKKKKNTNVFDLYVNKKENFSPFSLPPFNVKKLLRLEKKLERTKKKIFFYLPLLKKIKHQQKLLDSTEKFYLFLQEKILLKEKNVAFQAKKKKIQLLTLLKKIDYPKLIFRKKVLKKIYFQLKGLLEITKKKFLALFFQKILVKEKSFTRKKTFWSNSRDAETTVKEVNEEVEELRRKSFLHTSEDLGKNVFIPVGNHGSIWIASGKNFSLPSEAAISFSSFFLKKKAFASLKIVSPISGMLKITATTIHVSNKYSSFSIDLTTFQKQEKKILTKVSLLYKNLTYVDAHTTLAFLYIFPLVSEELHQAKVTLWQEKKKVSVILSSDTWSFALDPLNQEFAFRKKKVVPFLFAGTKITPTIIIPSSGKFLENDGFIYRYQKIFPIALRSGDFFTCRSGDFVEKKKILAYTFSQSLRNNDIIQGLPKIANLLESRYSEPYARLASSPGFFCSEKETMSLFRLSSMTSVNIQDTFSQKESTEIFPFLRNLFFTFHFSSKTEPFSNYTPTHFLYNYGLYRSFGKYEKNALYHNHLVREHSSLSPQEITDQIDQNTFLASYILDFFPHTNSYDSSDWPNGKFFSIGQPLTRGNIDAQVLVRSFFSYLLTKYGESYALFQSIAKVRFILKNSVQNIYISQGVIIADTHLELVIREMTSNLLIENGVRATYQNSFVKGEYCRFSTIFHLFNSLTIDQESLGEPITRKDFDQSLKESIKDARGELEIEILKMDKKSLKKPRLRKYESLKKQKMYEKFCESLFKEYIQTEECLRQKRKKISRLVKKKLSQKLVEKLQEDTKVKKKKKRTYDDFKRVIFTENQLAFPSFFLSNSFSTFLLNEKEDFSTPQILTEVGDNGNNFFDAEDFGNEENQIEDQFDEDEFDEDDFKEEKTNFSEKEVNLFDSPKFFSNYYTSYLLHTSSESVNFNEYHQLQKKIEAILKEKKMYYPMVGKNSTILELSKYFNARTENFPFSFFTRNLKQILLSSRFFFLPILPFQIQGKIEKKKYQLSKSKPLNFASNLSSSELFFHPLVKNRSFHFPDTISQNSSSSYFYSFYLKNEENFSTSFSSLSSLSFFTHSFKEKNEIDWFFTLFSSIGEQFLEKSSFSTTNFYKQKLVSFFSFLGFSGAKLSDSFPRNCFKNHCFVEEDRNLVETTKKIEFSEYLTNPICFLLFFSSFPSVLKKKEKYVEEKQKKMTFLPIILGITPASLAKSGILASAAFQEPKRILAKSSILGECEWFEGLKESVIAGKLIPGGSSLFNLRDSLDNLYYYHSEEENLFSEM